MHLAQQEEAPNGAQDRTDPIRAVEVFRGPGRVGREEGCRKREVGNWSRPGKLLVHSIPLPTLTEHPLCAEQQDATVLHVTLCILLVSQAMSLVPASFPSSSSSGALQVPWWIRNDFFFF